jgi:transketolase
MTTRQAAPARDPAALYALAERDFGRYEVIKDLIDECIDLELNYRQSGHPGGSRSKVHMLVALLLSGAMRWDIRRPWLTFGDRFVLSAGHVVPLVYATLAVLNESFRARAERGGAEAERYAFPDDGKYALTWEHLLGLRHRGGLPGHAEAAGRTLFLKANTGPSGHGMPFAAGEALALKLAGAEDVKVFVVEGEGGLTPGAAHETKNTAWGLGLSNLVFLVDWNDFGIDERPASAVVHGTPEDWFAPYGWRVTGTPDGMSWGPVTRAVLEASRGGAASRARAGAGAGAGAGATAGAAAGAAAGSPSMAWFKTQKGRGYGKVDAASHGTPHKLNSPEFWAVRKEFMARHGVEYRGVDEPAPADPAELAAQAEANLSTAIGVLRRDEALVDWLSDRLVEIAATVPDDIPGLRIEPASRPTPAGDSAIFDFEHYPDAMWRKPGEKQPNRAALATWGSYVNAVARRDLGRPLFIACSADLAESTNIAGFAKPFGDMKGFGNFERDSNPTGALLPTEITEFTNAGLMAGLATVNFAADPFKSFEGFWGACSTYASFSYLKYGPLRLFSQLAQDSDLCVGKVLYVAGHSGPETAEDSRTHFGIFSPGVTQLFPEGHVMDLHPWEYNEVPVVLGAAFATDVPIVVLHLTRPPIELPDRAALGMPSHFAAARGAYVLRPFREDLPKSGTIFVRGTMSTANLVKLLPELDEQELNVKIVAAISPQLFARQDVEYQAATVEPADRFDSMVITNGAYKLMRDWADDPIVREYSLSADWDDRWRTGGSVDEVIEEAHLDSAHILEAIGRFVRDRPDRHRHLRDRLDSAERR